MRTSYPTVRHFHIVWPLSSTSFPALAAGLLLAMAATAHGTIDTRALGTPAEVSFGFSGEIPDNGIDDDQDGLTDEDEEISRRHSIGQTFSVSQGQPVLAGIRVATRDEPFGDERDQAVAFRVRVMRWDPVLVRPMQDVLYESEVLTTVQDGGVVEHVISTGGLLLPSGIPLVVFLMQDEPDLSSGNNLKAFVAAREGGVYHGGSLVLKTNGTLGMGGVEADQWESMAQLDLSIQLTLEPLPSSGVDTSNFEIVTELPFGTIGDFPDNFIDDNQNGLVDDPNSPVQHRHTIGQTFRVPAASPVLLTVSFSLRDTKSDFVDASLDVDLEFSLHIMEWDPVELRPVGAILHQSHPRTVIQNGILEEVRFEALDLPLQPGKTHIAFLSQTGFGLADTGNNSGCFLLATTNTAYPFGQIFVKTDGTRTFDGLLEEPWSTVDADALILLAFSPPDLLIDSNGDGLPDYLVDFYGLDAALDYSMLATALRQAGEERVLAAPESYELYTKDSIMDLNPGLPIIQKTEDSVLLDFDIMTSTDLEEWELHEKIERTIPMPPERFFLRLRVDSAQPSP